MIKLYDISSDFRVVLDRIDENDGVVEGDLEADLDAIAGAFEEKTDACAVVIRELEAESAALKLEEQRLAARRKAVDASAARLESYVMRCFGVAGTRKVAGARFTVSLRASESVVVDADPATLPDGLRRTKTVHEADKTAIKAALKAGTAIAGCSIVSRDSLQVK